jgi:hypothetical protein
MLSAASELRVTAAFNRSSSLRRDGGRHAAILIDNGIG